MSDTAAPTPSGTPPVDRRPRPQYGELAPEGWVWEPRADAHAATTAASTTASPATDVAAPGKADKPGRFTKADKPTKAAKPETAAKTATFKPIEAKPAPAGAQPTNTLLRAVPAWDRYVTITLLFIGLFATFSAVSSFSAVPTVMQQLYTGQGLGTYVPAASVSATLLVGSILEGLIWAATAALSVSLMVRGKRSFYLPIIGAVIAGVVLFVFMIVVLVTDTNVLSFYSQP
ncbi:hypothetical protein D6T64_17080 [Cryobacterium melibiosiphilum]|uniref:Uncharacterized protein n=1 Tax=Cryobacterium melibiosiphilum TaxID=995039 RepID=A0A3A5MMP9_9MICO|nr:DUF6264 family protein [Cryobacterium melibiosiphilum]RJT86854.1 hypothetical protein D6T64_17080 [Cryobacterium melibiosiphilum]